MHEAQEGGCDMMKWTWGKFAAWTAVDLLINAADLPSRTSRLASVAMVDSTSHYS